jgi:RHS repeat-associated protein
VAGTATSGFAGDGGPARLALLNSPDDIAVGPDGSLYIGDEGNQRLRVVRSDGIIYTFAGGGTGGTPGSPATQVHMIPTAVALGPDGNVYVNNTALVKGNSVNDVGRIHQTLPGFSATDQAIASEDGSELYQFDLNGRHLRTLDALTGATLYGFGYDAAGRLISITDGDNNVTAIKRDSNGDPTAIVAPFGQVTKLSVDTHGYLASITDPAGGVDQYTYSPDGLMATFTDPRTNVHHFSYDTLGRLHVDQDPAGGSTTLDRTETKTGFQVTMTKAITATQNLVSTYLVETLPTGDEHRVNTGTDGLKTDDLIRSNGTETVTSPDGTVETVVRGPDPRWGMQAPVVASDTVKTPAGITSGLTEQRSAALKDPANPLSLQMLTDMFTVNGNSAVETYDAASRTFTITSAEGWKEVTTVDALGRLVHDQVANLEPLHATYDNHGLLTAIGRGSGATDRTFTLTPDSHGNLATVTSPLSLKTSFGYDPADRPSSLTLPGGQQTTQSYNADGTVQSLTPAGQPAHTFTYTPTGLLQTYSPPDIGTGPTKVTYGYNLDGQPNQITQPDGRQLTVGYDGAGRVHTLTLPGGQITYAYDPQTGNPQSGTAPDGGVLGYTYDGFLLTGLTWTGSVQGKLTQSYDKSFNLASQTVAGGATVDFHYDHDGLLTQAGALALSPDQATGLLHGTTLGNVATTNHYDLFGELSGFEARFNSTAVYSTQYTPDAEGRLHQVTETIGGTPNTFLYDYDANGQLRQVTENSTVIATYTYDANGNRKTITTPSGTVTAGYNAQDQLTQFGNNTYSYAADGSLAIKTSGSQTTTYAYDLLGNLTRVTLPDGTRIDYVIDGAGHRIGKKVNGTLVQGFLYDARGSPVAELDGNNNLVSQFIYGTKANVADYMERGGRTFRIVSDHLGSVRLVVDVATGAVVQRMDYDEFGNVSADTNPGFQPFGFAGGMYDQHTRLTRFAVRDYDAQIGRWTSKDPIGFAGGDTNLYAYVRNDPVNWVDFTGTKPQRSLDQQRIIQDIIDIVSSDPEFRSRTDSPLNGPTRNYLYELCYVFSGRNLCDPSYPAYGDKVCTGIANKAEELLKQALAEGRLQGVEGVEVIERRNQPGRQNEDYHTALAVKFEDGSEVVLDWWATLNAEKPKVTTRQEF